MADFTLYDGYKDQLSGESISYHYDVEPWRVRIEPKVKNTTFAIPSSIRSVLTAVDYGTAEGIIRGTIPSSRACGELIQLYFNPLHGDTAVFNVEWSTFLSSIKVLHDAFPPYLNHGGWNDPITIDSPDFEAPNGIFNGAADDPYFDGSTFKTAPRVYGEIAMKAFIHWPPASDFWKWEPFIDCPNVTKIAYQGDLSEKCEAIYRSNFVYVDEEGFERVDAYPSGAKPRIIDRAIGPLKRFELDSGSKFPIWDCSELEICHNPVVAEEVVLPTRSTQISLPVGPDVRSSTKLKSYINGIEKIVRGWEDEVTYTYQECPLVFGLKILGIDLPDTVERAANCFEIYRHQKQYGDIFVGIQATPSIVSSAFNFSLGSALYSFYNDQDEDLLLPKTGKNLVYTNHYGSVAVEEEYSSNGFSKPFYFIKLYPDGSLDGLQIPKIKSEKLRIVDGYLEWTFAHGRTGQLDFTVPGGASYSGDVKYTLPALPEIPDLVALRPYYYTCAYTSGKSETYTNSTPAAGVHLAYGTVQEYNEPDPGVVLNVDGSFFEGSSDEAWYLSREISPASYQKLWEVASGQTTEDKDYEVSLSRNGFIIETFNSSGLQLTVDWQTGLFYQAEVDPTTIPNVLIPLHPSTKVDGAYRYALDVKTPLYSSVKYYDQLSLNEPLKKYEGQDYVPTFTLIASYGVDEEMAQQYTYRLEDLQIQPFTLGDNSSTVFDSWSNVFSYLIYGDLEAFKTAHGIPEETEIGGRLTEPEVASGDYTGLGVLNWIVREFPDTNGSRVTIPASIEEDGSGQRGFGVRLYRENIPYYPDEAPLYGEPIFIDFSKVGANYIWSDGSIYSFRDIVKPQGIPTT